jgi:hypothetical protein
MRCSRRIVLQGKPEDLGETLFHYRFVHKFHVSDLDRNPGLRREKPATSRLSYGTALIAVYYGF